MIALPALPETHCPQRCYRRFAGEATIPTYNFIGIGAPDKIIVNRIAILRRKSETLLFVNRVRIEMFDRKISCIIRSPVDLNVMLLSFRDINTELVRPWIPVLAPFVDHQFFVDPYF